MPSRKISFILLLFLFLTLINVVSATQQYLNESNQWGNNITKVHQSALSWGDIDNDNDVDLIVIGDCGVNCRSSKVYINNGTTLTENSTWQENLTSVLYGSLALADIDNDGDLDLAISGCGGEADFVDVCDGGTVKVFIYLNNGTSFTESSQWQTNLTAVYRTGSLMFGDIDNDGDLDLSLGGKTENSRTNKIYLNNGTSFTESSQWQTNLINIEKNSQAFGDIDNDGDLDLIISGRDSDSNKLTKVYINNGTSFTESSQWQTNLIGVEDSSIALADFDNDGDLDLSLTGCCDKHRTYKNNGTSFVEIQREGEGLAGVFAGSQAFGDYDNDGDLDLITNGREEKTTFFLYNASSTNFTHNIYDPESHVEDLIYSSIAWLDLDNDADLDLIETGYGNFEIKAFVYLSNRSLTKSNTLPTPPISLNATYSNGILNISWGNGSDSETPMLGLYYNLMIGNSTDNHTIVSGIYGGSSNPTAGYFGNMMQRKAISLNKYLAEGTYYGYVQTIDTGLAKSEWSARQSFVVTNDATAPIISSVSSPVTSSTATITWTTDESANSTVYYGTTTATTSSSNSMSLVISHSIGLSGLSASTLYYYNVSSCDYWNNCNTSVQYSFTTSVTPANPPGGGGGSSSSSSTTTPPITTQTQEPEQEIFDVDFSKIESGNLESEEGEIKTFSFNSQTPHKITTLEVTNTSAKIMIESEPIILILNIGETKQIDINSDDINDFEIKLISITNGKANFSLTKLSGAEIVAQEEIEQAIRKEALFDVKVEVVNFFEVVKAGGDVIAEIEAFNINNIGQVDITINYYLTTQEDNQTKISQGSDTLAVEAVTSFVRSLTVPYNSRDGKYLFHVDITYQDKLMASGSAEFRVIRNYEIIILFGIVILIIVSIFVYLWRIKKKGERVARKEAVLEKIVRELKKGKK